MPLDIEAMNRQNDGQPFRVVIPARYGATRLPGKPLIEICGRPLVRWVWERACASAAAEVLIATDDPRIAEACTDFGAEVVMTRADHRSGSERIAEVAESMGWESSDIVVNLQGDEPGISPVLIDQVARGLAEHSDAGLSTLACRIDDAGSLFDPHVVKVLTDCNGYALYFTRAPVPWHRDEFLHDQTRLPSGVPFLRHIGLYAYHSGFLARYLRWPVAPLEQAESLEQLRVLWHGGRIHVSEAAVLPGPGVDTPDDVPRVSHWLKANV
jgi:3-deoxy-manno-octulosonate cytidylyltransferase (CMP-KDO synthetase)